VGFQSFLQFHDEGRCPQEAPPPREHAAAVRHNGGACHAIAITAGRWRVQIAFTGEEKMVTQIEENGRKRANGTSRPALHCCTIPRDLVTEKPSCLFE